MNEALTVLLVEDDAITLDAMRETLSEGGCAVRTASNHAEALAALEDCPHAAVLVTDIVLDGASSGLDLVRQVDAQRPDMGIIILSGEMRPETKTLPRRALFCTKPCAPGALLSLVQDCHEWQ